LSITKTLKVRVIYLEIGGIFFSQRMKLAAPKSCQIQLAL
jgi:hypothetical protein